MVPEIGVNMDVFPTAKHLCSWAGPTPTNNESKALAIKNQ
ncbi:hypothetical protein [Tissierella sp. MB52-C2]